MGDQRSLAPVLTAFARSTTHAQGKQMQKRKHETHVSGRRAQVRYMVHSACCADCTGRMSASIVHQNKVRHCRCYHDSDSST